MTPSSDKGNRFTKIELQSLVDALIYTQENTVVSNAHCRALKKLKRRLRKKK